MNSAEREEGRKGHSKGRRAKDHTNIRRDSRGTRIQANTNKATPNPSPSLGPNPSLPTLSSPSPVRASPSHVGTRRHQNRRGNPRRETRLHGIVVLRRSSV